MNVLLASVTERTREIGVRKAVGASRGDILLQLPAESVTISGLGSTLGAALGLAGAFAITALMRRETEAQVYAAFTWGTSSSAPSRPLRWASSSGSIPPSAPRDFPRSTPFRHE